MIHVSIVQLFSRVIVYRYYENKNDSCEIEEVLHIPGKQYVACDLRKRHHSTLLWLLNISYQQTERSRELHQCAVFYNLRSRHSMLQQQCTSYIYTHIIYIYIYPIVLPLYRVSRTPDTHTLCSKEQTINRLGRAAPDAVTVVCFGSFSLCL